MTLTEAISKIRASMKNTYPDGNDAPKDRADKYKQILNLENLYKKQEAKLYNPPEELDTDLDAILQTLNGLKDLCLDKIKELSKDLNCGPSQPAAQLKTIDKGARPGVVSIRPATGSSNKRKTKNIKPPPDNSAATGDVYMGAISSYKDDDPNAISSKKPRAK